MYDICERKCVGLIVSECLHLGIRFFIIKKPVTTKKMHVHNENANRRDFCGIIAGRVKKAVDDIVISADSIEVMHCILTWF